MRVPDAARMWRVQLTLEGKAFNSRGRLVHTPCPDPDELHSCYVTRYHGRGTEMAFAESAPDGFIRQAREIPLGRYFADRGVDRLFGPQWAVQREWFYTYHFASAPLSTTTPARVERRGPEHFAALVGGESVAEAMSSRSDDHAAELWVYTADAQQRRGYATQVATEWARAVLRGGKVAFYSHAHGNSASQALARHLQVVPLFELVAISV
jgi:hypothetical protein